MESVKSNEGWLRTLCYKENKQCINSSNDYGNKVFSKFVTFLARHLLEQNGCSKFNQSLFTEAYKSLQKFNNSDILCNNVQICKDCEIFAQNFCDYYQKIKELELQLDFKVDKLWDILKDADKVPLKVNQLEEHSTGENTSHAAQIYQLRNALKHNVEAYQNTRETKPFSRVNLFSETLNNVMPELEHVQDFISRVFSPINLEESITSFDDDNKTFEQVFTDENNEQENEIASSSTTTTVHKYNVEPVPQKITSNGFHCTFCTETFSVKFTLDQHTIRKHAAKYFSSVKFKFVTNKQFETYLEHVIEKNIDEFPNVDSKRQCPYCYIPKLFVERRSVKFHFVQHHRSVIKEKLIELQESDANNKNQLPMKQSISKRNVCQICSKVFKDGFSVQRHQTFIHPEIFFKNSELTEEDEEMFKIHVAYGTEKKVDQQFTKLKSANMVNGNKTKCKFKCVICSIIMIKRCEAKSHLVLKHRDIIEKALNEIRKSNKPFSEIKLELARFQYKSTTNHFPPAILRKLRDGTVEQQMECTICHKKLETSYELSWHDAIHHPDNFFLPVKSEHLTGIQFSLCVKQMFSKELGKFNRTKSSVKKKGKYICPCCKKLFTTLRDVRAHVLLLHFDIMAEKLKVLQKDLKAEDL